MFSKTFSEKFSIVRRIKPDIITNFSQSSFRVSVIPVRFLLNLNLHDRFSKHPQTLHLMKIYLVGAEFFSIWTDGHVVQSLFTVLRTFLQVNKLINSF
jgi:hypothetical protein